MDAGNSQWVRKRYRVWYYYWFITRKAARMIVINSVIVLYPLNKRQQANADSGPGDTHRRAAFKIGSDGAEDLLD